MDYYRTYVRSQPNWISRGTCQDSCRSILHLSVTNFLRTAYLGFNDCNFTGTLPIEMGNLTDLIRLRLQNNRLEGTIPTTFGQLSQLEEITMQGNNLSGSVAPAICDLRVQGSLTRFIVECPDPVSRTGLNCSVPDCCNSCRTTVPM